jgi:hypothetical protein
MSTGREGADRHTGLSGSYRMSSNIHDSRSFVGSFRCRSALKNTMTTLRLNPRLSQLSAVVEVDAGIQQRQCQFPRLSRHHHHGHGAIGWLAAHCLPAVAPRRVLLASVLGKRGEGEGRGSCGCGGRHGHGRSSSSGPGQTSELKTTHQTHPILVASI